MCIDNLISMSLENELFCVRPLQAMIIFYQCNLEFRIWTANGRERILAWIWKVWYRYSAGSTLICWPAVLCAPAKIRSKTKSGFANGGKRSNGWRRLWWFLASCCSQASFKPKRIVHWTTNCNHSVYVVCAFLNRADWILFFDRIYRILRINFLVAFQLGPP